MEYEQVADDEHQHGPWTTSQQLPGRALRQKLVYRAKRRGNGAERRKLSSCTIDSDCGAGFMCQCDAGRRLFGAPSQAPSPTCACEPAPSPPPPASPPPSQPMYDYYNGVVSFVAGSGAMGGNDATGAAASFHGPQDVAFTPDGATAIVVDTNSHRIRKLDIASGAVTTFAGSGSPGSTDATGTAASFYYPRSLALTPDGTMALVPDENHKIRAINIATSAVTTFAGSGSAGSTDAVGTAASFNDPFGVAITPDGATAIVVEQAGRKVRKIDMATQAVSFLAGSGSNSHADGTGAAASFHNPVHVAITPDGVTALATGCDGKIRAIVIATGVVTTIASHSGGCTYGVAISPDGLTALVSTGNYGIDAVDIATGAVTNFANPNAAHGTDDGAGAVATFRNPYGIDIAPNGATALVADKANNMIRMITFSSL